MWKWIVAIKITISGMEDLFSFPCSLFLFLGGGRWGEGRHCIFNPTLLQPAVKYAHAVRFTLQAFALQAAKTKHAACLRSPLAEMASRPSQSLPLPSSSCCSCSCSCSAFAAAAASWPWLQWGWS